jgi:hypothetical protein
MMMIMIMIKIMMILGCGLYIIPGFIIGYPPVTGYTLPCIGTDNGTDIFPSDDNKSDNKSDDNNNNNNNNNDDDNDDNDDDNADTKSLLMRKKCTLRRYDCTHGLRNGIIWREGR